MAMEKTVSGHGSRDMNPNFAAYFGVAPECQASEMFVFFRLYGASIYATKFYIRTLEGDSVKLLAGALLRT
jgi:hypothetical protein